MFASLYPAPDWLAARHGWPHAAHSQFVRTPQMRWHVQTMGQGPVALLLHGTGASTHSWRAVMPLLATHFHVVAIDLPGHGFSSDLENQRPTLPAVASAVWELLNQLQLKPALWIGHSAGAAIAARCCIDQLVREPQSENTTRVVGLNPAWLPLPGSAQWLFPLAAWLIGHNPLAGWLAAKQAQRPGAVERLLAGTGSHLDDEGIGYYRTLFAQSAHVRGVLRLMANWDLHSLQRDLHQLRCPVHMQIGAADQTVPPALAQQALSQMPHASLQTLPGLGHLAHEEAPALCVDDILAWCGVKAPGSSMDSHQTGH
jgi:magnesium chelatase accessory protein